MKLLLLLLSLGLLVVGCQSSYVVPGHVVPAEHSVQDGWQVE